MNGLVGEFSLKHPFRRDGKASAGNDRSTDTFRRRDAQTALDRDGDLGAVPPECPDIGRADVRVNDGLMEGQVAGHHRRAGLFEVSGGPHDRPRARPDLSGSQTGIGHRAHPKGDVDAFLDQVDIPIVENDFNFQVRILRQEFRDLRDDVQPRERHRSADTQLAGQPGSRPARREISLVGFFHRAPGPFVEVEASFRRCETPRRPNQQLDAQPSLQLGDGLGYGRLPYVQSSRGA
jgi:hypothetical protein